MTALRALRPCVVAAAGLAAGAGMWVALGPVEPHLDVTVRREERTEAFDNWKVTVKVRGGETLDEVRVEPVSGPVHVVTRPKTGVRSGVTAEFHLQLDDGRNSKGVVRVVQMGRVSRTYEQPLVESF